MTQCLRNFQIPTWVQLCHLLRCDTLFCLLVKYERPFLPFVGSKHFYKTQALFLIVFVNKTKGFCPFSFWLDEFVLEFYSFTPCIYAKCKYEPIESNLISFR